MSKHYPLIK